jgi:hypothetical protein
MQAQTLINYIKNPDLMDKESVPQLQKLVKDFPYFQTAYILLSLAAKKWDATVYQQSLKKTAIVISNRAHLFNLINNINEVTSVIEPMVEKKEEIIEENKTELQSNTTLAELADIKSSIEDIKHELDLIKATELTSEQAEVAKPELTIITDEKVDLQATPEKVEDKAKIVEVESSETLVNETIEKELEKSLVNAFIEKEVIKTPELHHLELNKTQAKNFSEWLQLLKKNNGQSAEEIKEQIAFEKEKQSQVLKTNKQIIDEQNQSQLKKQKQKALIDKIIETNPGAIRNKEDKKFFAPIIQAKESLIENEHLVTETLAKIYSMQGNINKAVRAYEILSLKFPQKSVYFATLIKNLKENQ